MSVSTIGLTTSTADRKRRAGQRLILGLAGTSIQAEERELIRALQPAGFILFSRNVEEPAQVRELNRELRSLVSASTPALCSVDQEGGRVQRIKAPATVWPPMLWLGNVGRTTLSAAVGRAMALELRAMDFDLDYAPVADIHSNPQNPVIGDRSFGPSARGVIEQMVPFFQAMQEEGLIACAKHFPGHGDTRTDSHLELPVVEEDPDRLMEREIAPFAAAVRAGIGMVMTAHVLYPAFDEQWPATMSSRILGGILRKKLGYSGVIVSDDLEMKAVRGRYPLDMQLQRATAATVDLFLCCKEPQLQHEAWENLIRLQEEDKVQDQLATDSFRRIQAMRERFLKDRPAPPELSLLGCPAHQDLVMQIRAEGAV